MKYNKKESKKMDTSKKMKIGRFDIDRTENIYEIQ